MKAYLALIKIDLKLAMRARTVIVFNYMFPLIFFFIFAQSSHAEQGGVVTQVLAMVCTIGIIGNGLFGAGIRAVQERENNTLRRYKVTPIGPVPLLVASMVTGLVLYFPSVFLILALSIRLYHMQMPEQIVPILLFILVGVLAFRSIGLIIASVTNTMQESMIVVQLSYFAMLFLSGATFPITDMPKWLQTITQFIPATYLVSGLQGMLVHKDGLDQNLPALGALFLTLIVATLVATKIFRWEKEEKIRPSAKLWLLGIFMPFLALGAYQSYSRQNLDKAKIIERQMHRSRTRLIRNARIFVGEGSVIESGSVLVRNGKIAEIYSGAAPDAKELNADPIEASGKTVLPGLVDVHVHLVAPGGVPDASYRPGQHWNQGALSGYLYAGVTAVKSVGDPLDDILETRRIVNSGQHLGAELFAVGPLFTAENGHGTEYFKQVPAQYRDRAMGQFVRMPKTPEDARKMVADLKALGVDGVKAVLESGAGGTPFNRLDTNVLNAIAAEARAQSLSLTVHTGDAHDVSDALNAGANGIEHGSLRDRIPDELFARMAKNGVAYDPTLSVAEGFHDFRSGKLDLLNRSLVQQVGPKDLLAATKKAMLSPDFKKSDFPIDLDIAKENLRRAWKAGVMLVTGSDAGNPLVFHGPTIQREVELWVDAGIPATVALQAATSQSAKFLRAGQRFGTLRKGMEATMLVVDGNPLQDIHAINNISFVVFKGERVDRSAIFDQN